MHHYVHILSLNTLKPFRSLSLVSFAVLLVLHSDDFALLSFYRCWLLLHVCKVIYDPCFGIAPQ